MTKTLLKGKLYSLINKSNIMSDEDLAKTLEKFNGSNNHCLTEEDDENSKNFNKKNKNNFHLYTYVNSNKFEDDRVKIEELMQKNFNNQERKTIFAYPQFFGIYRNPVFKEFAKVQSKNLKDVLDKEEVLFKNKILEEKETNSKRAQNKENSEEVSWFNYFYFNDIFHNKKKNKKKNINPLNSNGFNRNKSNKTFSMSKKNMSCNRVSKNKISPIKLKEDFSKKKLIVDYEKIINNYGNTDRKQFKDPNKKMKGYDERRKIMQDKRKIIINKMKENYKLKHMKKMKTSERDYTERKYVDNIISILRSNYSHI